SYSTTPATGVPIGEFSYRAPRGRVFPDASDEPDRGSANPGAGSGPAAERPVPPWLGGNRGAKSRRLGALTGARSRLIRGRVEYVAEDLLVLCTIVRVDLFHHGFDLFRAADALRGQEPVDRRDVEPELVDLPLQVVDLIGIDAVLIDHRGVSSPF